jgi:hypothetical protein
MRPARCDSSKNALQARRARRRGFATIVEDSCVPNPTAGRVVLDLFFNGETN